MCGSGLRCSPIRTLHTGVDIVALHPDIASFPHLRCNLGVRVTMSI